MRMGDLMTTDQIKRTEAASGAAEGDSAGQPVDLDAAREEAKEIVAKARYDAFRMVTDARNEAEAILSEAEQPNPSTTAPQVAVDQSELDSLTERRDELIHETDRLIDLQTRLEEKVASTRVLLQSLEARLAKIAAAPPPTQPAPPATERAPEMTVEVHIDTDDPAPLPPAASTAMDYSPSVPHPVKHEEVHEVAVTPEAELGSFYSRNSAKLPSIGSAGGQSALSAVSSIRSRITD